MPRPSRNSIIESARPQTSVTVAEVSGAHQRPASSQGREATEPVGANFHHQPAYGAARNETAARTGGIPVIHGREESNCEIHGFLIRIGPVRPPSSASCSASSARHQGTSGYLDLIRDLTRYPFTVKSPMCQAMSLYPSLTGGETIDLAGVASMSVIEGVAIGPDAGSMAASGEHRDWVPLTFRPGEPAFPVCSSRRLCLRGECRRVGVWAMR